MAFSTTKFDVTPGSTDGDWVQVAVNPSFLNIRIAAAVPWQMTVTAAGAPAAGAAFIRFDPNKQQDGWKYEYSGSALTAEFYVRVPQQKALQDKVQFGVVTG